MFKSIALALSACAVMAGASLASAGEAAGLPLDTYLEPQRLVTLPDGRKMNLFCLGEGGPTVLLEAGLGGFSASWHTVHARLAEKRKVCAYDRAGAGFSDPGPLPRSVQAINADLEALIEAAELQAPFVLVGHSAGSFHVRMFAFEHPEQVVGIVLVDPASESQPERLAAVSPKRSAGGDKSLERVNRCIEALKGGELTPGEPGYDDCKGRPLPGASDAVNAMLEKRRFDLPARLALRSEYLEVNDQSAKAIVEARRPLGDMPIVVLTAENTQRVDPAKPDPEMVARKRVWWEMHDEMAMLSTRGVHRWVEDSGHAIQDQQPDAVIAAVEEVIAKSAAK